MSYRRSAEDKRRGRKHRNLARKEKVMVERAIQAPPRKDWIVVTKPMATWAKNNNIPTKRKGGMWFVLSADYQHVDLWYDQSD